MSKYSVGLRNVGSYMVSGQPYITGSAVNAGDQVKIEFPFVTKNITIRIPSPPNNAVNIDDTGGGQVAYFWSNTLGSAGTAFGFNGPTNLPGFTGSAGDWTYSMWFKIPGPMEKNKYVWTAYGYNGVTMLLHGLNPGSATNYGFAIATGNNASNISSDYSTTLTFNDVQTNWNHILVTQLTSSTHIYVNGSFVAETTTLIGNFNNLQKGWNSQAKIFDSISFDEEMLWNTGMNNAEVDELYNYGEWVNPNSLSTKDSLVAWWTYGDGDNDKYAPGLTGINASHYNVFRNRANGTSNVSAATLGLHIFDNATEVPSNVPGPFTSQTTGKIRVAQAPFYLGAINYPDDDGDGDADDYLQVPLGSTVDVSSQPFAFSFWFKQETSLKPAGSAYERFYSSTPNGIQGRISHEIDGEATIRNDIGGLIVVSNLDLYNNSWHHYAMVFDPDLDKSFMYLDGQEIGTHTSGLGSTSLTNLYFPSNPGVIQNWADIAIWDVALTAPEISEIYNGGYASNLSNHSRQDKIRSWYKFTQQSSPPDTTTTIYDRVGSNDATVIGGGFANFIQGPTTSVIGNKHYHELQGYGSSISLPMKTKEVYLQGVGAQVTSEVIAELTNIPTGSMYTLSGAGIDE